MGAPLAVDRRSLIPIYNGETWGNVPDILRVCDFLRGLPGNECVPWSAALAVMRPRSCRFAVRQRSRRLGARRGTPDRRQRGLGRSKRPPQGRPSAKWGWQMPWSALLRKPVLRPRPDACFRKRKHGTDPAGAWGRSKLRHRKRQLRGRTPRSPCFAPKAPCFIRERLRGRAAGRTAPKSCRTHLAPERCAPVDKEPQAR